MSTTYSGIAALADNLHGGKITGATNASPIVITQTAHGFTTGDQVIVLLVGGNTAANSPQNSPWTITVINANSYSLNNSTGNGSYTSGGYGFSTELWPPFQIPSDGDAFTAGSILASIEALADRQAKLSRILGLRGYNGSPQSYTGQLINQYLIGPGSPQSGWAAWSTGTPSGAGWGVVASFPSPLYSSAPAPLCNYNDFFDCSFVAGQANCTGNPGRFAIAALFQNASPVSAAQNAYDVIGAAAMVQAGATHPLSLRATTACTQAASGVAASITAFSGGVMTVTLGGATGVVGAGTLVLSGCATAGNNGRFKILSAPSGTSVTVSAPGGSATDANNGALRWHIDDQVFDFQLRILGVSGSQPTYTLTGDYALVVNHYRPNAIIVP